MQACRPRLSVDYPPSTIIQGNNIGKHISYLRALGVAEALTAPTAAAVGVGALGAARPAGAASGDGRVLLCQTARKTILVGINMKSPAVMFIMTGTTRTGHYHS